MPSKYFVTWRTHSHAAIKTGVAEAFSLCFPKTQQTEDASPTHPQLLVDGVDPDDPATLSELEPLLDPSPLAPSPLDPSPLDPSPLVPSPLVPSPLDDPRSFALSAPG